MKTCAVCSGEIPDDAERCLSCDAPVARPRPVIADESGLPEDMRREVDEARRQLLIPTPIERGFRTIVEDTGRALAIAAGGVLLAMIVAWFAFRVL